MNRKPPALKTCIFVGSSRRDLQAFPDSVRQGVGLALYEAQNGLESTSVKALKGFGGRQILEVVEGFDGDTYRAVYTVRFVGVIYVLHVFQKKSKKGISTPKQQIELIKRRLRVAEEHYKQRQKKED
jgi:phage-related protein